MSSGLTRAFVRSWRVGLLCALAGSACRQDMHDQPKYIPMRESTFFADTRSARPIVAGTVARGQLREDTLRYTGKVDGADATVFPVRRSTRTFCAAARSGSISTARRATPGPVKATA